MLDATILFTSGSDSGLKGKTRKANQILKTVSLWEFLIVAALITFFVLFKRSYHTLVGSKVRAKLKEGDDCILDRKWG